MSSIFTDPSFVRRRPDTSGHYSREATLEMLEALMSDPDSSVNKNFDRRFKEFENSFGSRLNALQSSLQSSQVELADQKKSTRLTAEQEKHIRDLITHFVANFCDISVTQPRFSSSSEDVYDTITQYVKDHMGIVIARPMISAVLKELGHAWDQSDTHYFFRNLKLKNSAETTELERPTRNPVPFSPAPGQGTSRVPLQTPFQTPGPSPAPVFQSARR
jgi:hypothetical protein